MTRVLGIAGISYCGSTVLGAALGRLPGVVHVGESLWARRGDGDLGRCQTHGAACPRWTPAALDELRACPAEAWWQELSAQVGSPQVLVSGDKSVAAWSMLGLPDLFLLPYRLPLGWLQSFAAHGDVPDVAARAGEVWRFAHDSRVPCIAIYADALSRAPERVLPALAARLDLPWSDAALAPWEAPGCRFGGNSLTPGWGRPPGAGYAPAPSVDPLHAADMWREIAQMLRRVELDAAA